ncbi:hypothetical protein KY284_024096 [Solanum tuberosum]|nr:hypothetical protein KY284_024096 [Solanum tuberosum]
MKDQKSCSTADKDQLVDIFHKTSKNFPFPKVEEVDGYWHNGRVQVAKVNLKLESFQFKGEC